MGAIPETQPADLEARASAAVAEGQKCLSDLLSKPAIVTSLEIRAAQARDLNLLTKEERRLTATLKLSGYVNGLALFKISPDSSIVLTRFLLGFSESEEVENEDVFDAVKETANILINRLIGTLFHPGTNRINMSHPELAESELTDQAFHQYTDDSQLLFWQVNIAMPETGITGDVQVVMTVEDGGPTQVSFTRSA